MPDLSATVCKYFPSLMYLTVFNPLVSTERNHTLISPECSNCTKATSEDKTDLQISQFLPVQTRGFRKTSWFFCITTSPVPGCQQMKASAIAAKWPSSHQNLRQEDGSVPARAGRSQSPSSASWCPFCLLTRLPTGGGAASGHTPISSPCCRAALSSTRSLRVQLLIFIPIHPCR